MQSVKNGLVQRTRNRGSARYVGTSYTPGVAVSFVRLLVGTSSICRVCKATVLSTKMPRALCVGPRYTRWSAVRKCVCVVLATRCIMYALARYDHPYTHTRLSFALDTGFHWTTSSHDQNLHTLPPRTDQKYLVCPKL